MVPRSQSSPLVIIWGLGICFHHFPDAEENLAPSPMLALGLASRDLSCSALVQGTR